MRSAFLSVTCIAALLCAMGGRALQLQQTRAEWLTDRADAQRTGWQKNESRISRDSAPRLQLDWKLRLDNEPRQMHALLPALIADRVQTAAGLKQIVVVAGVSDNLFGIDASSGTLLWSTHFDLKVRRAINAGQGSVQCPGGQTATPVIAAAGPNRYLIYALSWDGRLRQVDAATGREIAAPLPFVDANGKPYALNLWNGVIYTTTAQGCNGKPNLVYALDLASKQVATFSPGGGGMWGRAGPSIGSDGTVYTGTGDGIFNPARKLYNQAIIAVQRTVNGAGLLLRDYFGPANAEWMYRHDLDMNVTGPVFTFHGREYIVQSSKECRLWLLDTASLGGADHRTPTYSTPQLCNETANFESAGVWGALASWEGDNGTRWVLAPVWGPLHSKFSAPLQYGPVTHGAIAAFRLEDRNGGLALAPVWLSRDMDRAEPPIIANGVVLAFASGESTRQVWPNPRLGVGARGRIGESSRAVVYALDAETGRELWNSGDQIASWSHSGGLSVANGRVFLGTYDGFLYSFGVPNSASANVGNLYKPR